MLRQNNIADPKSTIEKKAADRQVQSHIIQSTNRDTNYPYVVDDNDNKNKKDNFVLHPPFRILQIGATRSGSTFQYQALIAIAHLKSSPGTYVNSGFPPGRQLIKNINDEYEKNGTFVFKTHFLDKEKYNGKELFFHYENLEAQAQEGKVVVFSSGLGDLSNTTNKFPFVVYTQDRKQLECCQDDIINDYVRLFNLNEDEKEALVSYINNYGILRQCCSLQMSKYEMLRLNKCPMDEDDADPHCEKKNLTDVELKFSASPIPYEKIGEKNWGQPGDCNFFREKVAGGIGFNGLPFTKCQINNGRAADKKN